MIFFDKRRDRGKLTFHKRYNSLQLPAQKSQRLPTVPPGVENPRLIAQVLSKRTEKHNFQQILPEFPSRFSTDFRYETGN
jgi:hypothetical protein